jgi:hypothetical protein
VGISRLTRAVGIRPIPFGGQALVLMAVHVLLTSLVSQSLTVNQFIVSDDPEQDWIYDSIEWGILAVIMMVAFCFWALGWRRAFRRTVLIYLGLSILELLMNCGYLVSTLGQRTAETGGAYALLWDAALSWVTNVLTFTLWYWFLDQGGPDRRRSDQPGPPDFAFPQQTNGLWGWERWTPGLVDYLFLAFSTSTAFSPTDTLVLSPWAKALTMLQAVISLIIVAMLAARVVNMIA